MEVSIFLAKCIGAYFVILSIAMMLQRRHYNTVAAAFLDNMPLLFLAALITTILGLLLVVAHNQWTNSWPVLITILAWITLLKGVLLMCFPRLAIAININLQKSAAAHYTWSIISLLIGIFLLYHGLQLFF